MKAAMIVGGIFLTLILAVAGVAIANWVSYSNFGNEQEQTINASYENNKNILGQYSLKVKEAAKVSDKYSDALTKVIEGALTARYGDEGSQAAMQWITEQNPNMDAQVFIKIQQIIESGRNEFQVSQTSLLDKCRIYKTNLGYVWGGFWLKLAGYPKDGLEKRCTAITSDYAKDAFNTGVEKGVEF